MAVYEEDIARLVEIDAEKALIEQRLAENPQRQASVTEVEDEIAADTWLQANLPGIVVEEGVHPDWVNVILPLAGATGVPKLAIFHIVEYLKKQGAEPEYVSTPKGVEPVMMVASGKVYVHRQTAIEAIGAIAVIL